MKVGDLVRWRPNGVKDPCWTHWVGILLTSPFRFAGYNSNGEPQYGELRARVKWNKDNGIITTSFLKDMELVGEFRKDG